MIAPPWTRSHQRLNSPKACRCHAAESAGDEGPKPRQQVRRQSPASKATLSKSRSKMYPTRKFSPSLGVCAATSTALSSQQLVHLSQEAWPAQVWSSALQSAPTFGEPTQQPDHRVRERSGQQAKKEVHQPTRGRHALHLFTQMVRCALDSSQAAAEGILSPDFEVRPREPYGLQSHAQGGS